MNSNSDNPRVGKSFQIAVKEWFEATQNMPYQLEVPIPIGSPAKLHRFDIADSNVNVVIECKCNTWTTSGNVPSAKMGFTNEAAFYLSFLPDAIKKYIVMAKSTHPRHTETLAEYYFKTNCHLLGKIRVLEYDVSSNEMRLIGKKKESFLPNF